MKNTNMMTCPKEMLMEAIRKAAERETYCFIMEGYGVEEFDAAKKNLSDLLDIAKKRGFSDNICMEALCFC